jgi:very-short-patch-repair endonuclease
LTCLNSFSIFVEITDILKEFLFMINCKECNREYESLDSLRRHRNQKHGINAEQTYIDYVLNGNEPKCRCGCGEKPKYLGIDAGYRDYIRGHAARVKNNWGHNSEALKKSHETQKKMHDSGELNIWNKGLTIEDERVRNNIDKVMSNPNRSIKISKKLIGVTKTEKHKENIKIAADKRWESNEEREKQSQRLITNLIKNNYRNKKSNLEIKFQKILESLGYMENIDFKYQYQVSSAIFDFVFINKNILMEVDGDFHHCNPNTKHVIPFYPIQIKTVGNDIRKNKIADINDYKLLRFWESDINNNQNEIITKLKNELF